MTIDTQRFLDRRTPPHIATLILIAGLSAMAMNMFLPSLPGMTAYFETDYRLMQLSVALYLGVSGVLQVFIGPISDRFGRRPIMLIATLLFALVTLGCIFAPTVEIFLAFRMAQAVIAAGMVLSRAAVRDIVEQDQAASMIAYVTMGMALVPMFAPAFGGFLDQAFGWKSSFWALFVLGIAMLWLVWADWGETVQTRGQSFGEQLREWPELLTARRFWGYCLTMALASGAFFAYLGGAPYVGSEIFGMEPAVLGFFFGAPAIGYMAGNFLSGRYSARYGVNFMVVVGSIVATTGPLISTLLYTAGFSNVWVFFGFMTLVGLGNGMVIPNATAGMLSVRPHLAGTASGLGGAMMIGGGAALSALAGIWLEGGTSAMPLLLLMLGSTVCSILTISYTIFRERQVQRG